MTHIQPTTTGPAKQPYADIAEALILAIAAGYGRSECCGRAMMENMDGSGWCSGCREAC